MHSPTLITFALALLSYASAAPVAKRQSVPASPSDVTCGGSAGSGSGKAATVYADETVTKTITTHVHARQNGALPFTHSSHSTSLGGGGAWHPSGSATGWMPSASGSAGTGSSSASGSASSSDASGSGSLSSSNSIPSASFGSSSSGGASSSASSSGGSPITGTGADPTGTNTSTGTGTTTATGTGTGTSGSQSNSAPSGSGSSSAPSSTPSGGGAGSAGNGDSPHGKKGITYNNAADLAAFSSSAKWATNWEQNNDGVPSGMGYYPMLWNDAESRTSRWAATAQAAIDRGDKVLFSFNEPVASLCPDANPPPKQPQACMTAQVAAQVWKDQMLPWKAKGAILVGPSVPQGDEGVQWMQDWIKACPQSECGWSAIALHWYEAASQLDYFNSYFTEASSTYGGVDIWVNEFAPTSGSAQEQSDFYKNAASWMDSQDFIKGYSPFMADTLAPGGQLTPAIQGYVS